MFLPVDCDSGLYEQFVGYFFVTGMVAGMGFPTFNAENGCVFSLQHDDTHGT